MRLGFAFLALVSASTFSADATAATVQATDDFPLVPNLPLMSRRHRHRRFQKKHFQTTRDNRHFLRNMRHSVDTMSSTSLVECNPDVGVLDCGAAGTYCLMDPASSLGGFCQSQPTEPTSPDNRHWQQVQQPRRHIGERDILPRSVWIFDCCETESDALDPAKDPYCNCDEWNFQSQYGMYTYQRVATYCFSGNGDGDYVPSLFSYCPGLCATVNITLSSDGLTYDYSYCMDIVSSQERSRFCFHTESWDDGSCEMELNGVACNSCETWDKLQCIAFDCENIDVWTSGSQCEVLDPTYYLGVSNVMPLYDNVVYCHDQYEMYCSICPDSTGGVTYPTATVEIPGYGTVECLELDTLVKNAATIPLGDGDDAVYTCPLFISLARPTCCVFDSANSDLPYSTITTNGDGDPASGSLDDYDDSTDKSNIPWALMSLATISMALVATLL